MRKTFKKPYLKIFNECFYDFFKKEEKIYYFMSNNLDLNYSKYVNFCQENNIKERSRAYCIYRYFFKKTINWNLVNKNGIIPRHPFFGSSLEELVGHNILKLSFYI